MKCSSLRAITARVSKVSSVQRTSMILAAAATAIAASSAHAQVKTWTGAGADANWLTAANWDLGAPVALDTLQFGGTTQLAPNNDFVVDTQFNGINFLAGAGSFTLGGNGIILGGDINNNSGVAQTIAFTPTSFTFNAVTYPTGGLVLDGATSNVNVSAGGSLNLGQVTFGAAPQSANVSTLNINNSVSATGLTVQTRSASANTINIASGQTFTVAGPVYIGTMSTVSGTGNIPTNVNFTGGGSLDVTSGNFYVGVGTNNFGSGDRNVARVDMTALSNFTYSGGGNFGVGWMTRPDAQLRLAAGSNTIIADQIKIGDSRKTGTDSADDNAGTTARLFLGAGTNVLRADNIHLGRKKGAAVVDWQNPASGSVTIAAEDGVGRANITLGNFDSGSATGDRSQMLLAGHTANVLANTVTIGRLNATGSSALANEITFDTGTFDVNVLEIARNVNGVAPNGIRGAFVLGGAAPNPSATGVLTVNNEFYLGRDTTDDDAVETQATFTINGGTANINTDIQVVRSGPIVVDDPLTPADDGDISRLTLAGGTLNMNGNNIGSYAAPVQTIDLSGGTLSNANVIAGNAITVGATAISGSPKYVLADAGTLTSSGLTLASGQSLSGGGATAATVTGDVTAQSGARIDPGSDDAAGTLTFNNNLTLDSGSALRFKLSGTPGAGNDLINVGGNLTATGSVAIDIGILGAGASFGSTYTLFNYTGTLTGDETNFVINNPGTRTSYEIVDTATTPNSIQLTATGSAPLALTWLGNTDNEWKLSGAQNWKDASANPETFFNQDTVTFNDDSTNLNDVQIVGNVAPAAVTVSASRNYRFAGTGGLSGGTTIQKEGGGTLRIANPNNHTGGTNIAGGTIEIQNGGSLGTGTVTNSNVLRFNRTDASTFANVIDGFGNIEHSGTGTTTLSGNSTHLGNVFLQAGTIVATNSGSLGAAGQSVIIFNDAALDVGGSATANNINFGNKLFEINGDGPAGNGALTNSGLVNQQNAFQQVSLASHSTVGGPGRIDIRAGQVAGANVATLSLNNNTLTKVGTGQFSLVATNVGPGNIVVNQGIFAVETTSSLDAGASSLITMNDGTAIQFFNVAAATAAINRKIRVNGNVMTGTSSGGAQSSTIGSEWELNGDLTIGIANNNTGALILNGNITEVGGPRSIIKTGTTTGGAVTTATLNGTLGWTGNTTVNNGTLVLNNSLVGTNATTIAGGAVLAVGANGSRTLGQKSLSIASGGVLDLGDNDLLVDYGALDPSPEGTIRQYVRDGRNAGLTSGIKSTPGATADDVVLAVADNAEWGKTVFNGINIDASTIVGKYTYFGDSNLDGQVTGDDYLAVDSNLGTGNSWNEGDFNMDNSVTGDDYLAIDTNLGKGTLNPLAFAELKAEMVAKHVEMFGEEYLVKLAEVEANGFQVVPEPGALSLVGLCAIGLLGRRRRRA